MATEISKCVRRLVDGRQTHTRACTNGTASCDLSATVPTNLEG